jgi:hypothetical protein
MSYIRTMRRSPWLLCALALVGCKKATPPPAPTPPAAADIAADAVKEQALRDLQNDIILIKAQLAALTPIALGAAAKPAVHVEIRPVQINTAIYLCDRLAIASRELADDARAQPLLGEADALCAYQVPLAAGEHKLAALETTRGSEPPPKSAPSDCGPIRDALARVGAKYKNDGKLADLVRRFKTDCPRMRLASPSRVERTYASAPAPDLSAQRDACRKRCDDAAFDCRSRCQYCGSCTTDKTWEWCNATCNNCKQGCEQNERFCQASCGS